MNILTRWSPLHELDEAHRRMASLLGIGPAYYGREKSTTEDQNIAVADWAPLVDIAEDDKEYLVKAELPEVAKEDVKVTVENGTLKISGERKAEKEENGRKFHRVERYYGRFERSFSIPEDADGNNVSAGFKDGVLRVRVAKSEKALPRQIEVKVN
jgi:HSP20 family protein